MQLRSANVVLPGVSLRLLLVLTPLAAQARESTYIHQPMTFGINTNISSARKATNIAVTVTMRTGSVFGCIPAQGTSIQVIQGSDNSCHNFGSGDSVIAYGPDTECVQMAYSNTDVNDVAIPMLENGGVCSADTTKKFTIGEYHDNHLLKVECYFYTENDCHGFSVGDSSPACKDWKRDEDDKVLRSFHCRRHLSLGHPHQSPIVPPGPVS
ncbi:hypothetical protein V8F06_009767 [Rhypophila decipiens]